MPRSFLNSARDYRNGKYFGNDEHNPYVMLTRSGLSIKKVPVKAGGSLIKQTLSENVKDERIKEPRKPRANKYKSMHYLSFVTRFYLYMRVPGLDITGTNHRETLRFLQNIPIGSRGFGKENGVDNGGNEDDSSTSGDDEDKIVVECDTNKELDELILGIADGLDNKEDNNVNDNAAVSLQEANNDDNERDSLATHQKVDIAQNALISDLNNQYKKFGADKSFPTQEDQFGTNGIVEKIKETQNVDDNKVDLLLKDLTHTINSVSTISNSISKLDHTFVPLIESDYNISSSEKSDKSPGNQSIFSRDRGTVSNDHAFPGDLQIQLVPGDDGKNFVKCPECDKAFTIVSEFTAHMKTHFKCRNMCYLCGKIFTRSWLLTGHLRTHSGEKPYLCTHEGCQKAFADKSNLRSHLMIHSTNKKVYNCDKCGRAFAQKRYLHKHVQEVCRQPPL